MIKLAVIVGAQALLISWAAMIPLLGLSYVFSNFAMVFLGIHLLANPSNLQAFAIFCIFFTFTLFHDGLCWLAYFPDFSGLKTVDMLALGVAALSSLLKPCQLAVLCTEYSKLGADMSYSTLDDIFSLRPPSRMASDDVEYKSYNNNNIE
mmetsp:Transcript_16517/g.29653  ORF Transcript_16517/g.29653 Transcript_16517/m.29653 type:complete len:150 (+) Transcript_16517:242-691(+)